ncbi:hypothetical protein [Sporosarcina sp. YIM B06819]|uniref:sensor histidine kinase n=1 Tax=Sporosarcina sp. YIM B06819 TaxID=3081769 RepID=UPI00298CDC64|nr:hypothetical protein [Sporosarcina sp. YIM B06819]
MIRVRDSGLGVGVGVGVGVDEEQLQHLRNRLVEPSISLLEEHICLKNVHDQIRYYFGDQYGLEIASALGEGTTVTIRIPASL